MAVELLAQALEDGGHQLRALEDPTCVGLDQRSAGTHALPGHLGGIDALNADQGRHYTSKVNDGACPEQSVHLILRLRSPTLRAANQLGKHP